MKGTFLLVLMLEWVLQGDSCEFVNSALFCTSFPNEFPAGVSTLVISVKNAGEINSSVFHHDSLASVTSVIIRGSGVTGFTEGAFLHFLGLTSLTLDQNELADINHKWLGRPAVLSELGMSENHLSVLNEEMLREFTNLSKLDLSRNRLHTVHPGTFADLGALTLLDLSDNNLTQLSPHMFSPLHDANMSLQGNPWACSCDADDFIQFIFDLKSRSLLLHAEDVTCASPPALRGQPVWDISSCNGTFHSYPTTTTDTPGPSHTVTTLTTYHVLNVSRPIEEKRTTLNQKTGHSLDTTTIATHQRPPHPASNIVPKLITVIVVLCVILLSVIILAVLYRKKRDRKRVAPRDRSQEAAEEQGHQKGRDTRGTACCTAFTGLRARSANAILFTFPFGVRGEGCIGLAQSEDEEDGELGADGVSAEGGNKDSVPLRAGNATSTVECENDPYLSMGSCPNDPSDDMHVKGIRPGAMMGRVLPRTSTWPITAAQMRERCKREQEHGEGPTWAHIEGVAVPFGSDEAGCSVNNYRKGCMNKTEIQQCFTEDETRTEFLEQEGRNMTEPVTRCSVRDENDSIFGDSLGVSEDAVWEDRDIKLRKTAKQRVSAEEAGVSDMGSESKKEKTKRSASKAPSSGGTEHVFQDLLHEVVQNRGRWTRDRWRQIHMSK